jgi:hypothetical protein
VLELVDIRTPGLPEQGFSYHPTPDGLVRMVWYSEQPTAARLVAGQPLAVLTLRARRTLPSVAAQFNNATDDRWPSQAFDADGRPRTLQLAAAADAAVPAAAVLQAAMAPNPATDGQSAQLRLQAPRKGEGTLTITDLNGREVHRQPLRWAEGTNTWVLPTATWPGGTYVWRIDGAETPGVYGRLLRY